MITDSWPHCVKGDKEFRAVGIKEGGERVADLTKIITQLKGDSTVIQSSKYGINLDLDILHEFIFLSITFVTSTEAAK